MLKENNPQNCVGGVDIKRQTILLLLLLLTSLGVGTANATSVISGEGYTTGCYEGYYTHYAFYNYCPLCGHIECLMQGYKRYDEITCTVCDADYSFSGKEKMYNPRGWLTVYSPPEATISKKETTQKKPTKLELMKKTVKTHNNIL